MTRFCHFIFSNMESIFSVEPHQVTICCQSQHPLIYWLKTLQMTIGCTSSVQLAKQIHVTLEYLKCQTTQFKFWMEKVVSPAEKMKRFPIRPLTETNTDNFKKTLSICSMRPPLTVPTYHRWSALKRTNLYQNDTSISQYKQRSLPSTPLCPPLRYILTAHARSCRQQSYRHPTAPYLRNRPHATPTRMAGARTFLRDTSLSERQPVCRRHFKYIFLHEKVHILITIGPINLKIRHQWFC